MSQEGIPEAPWPPPQAFRRRTTRLKRIARWFYDHASNVGVFTALAAVVGSIYLVIGDAGPNILVVVPGIALIGLFFFAVGALLSALVGALFDLAAYTFRRTNKAHG